MKKKRLKQKILSMFLVIIILMGNIPQMSLHILAEENASYTPELLEDALEAAESEIEDYYNGMQHFTELYSSSDENRTELVKVNVSILGDSKHDGNGGTHGLAMGGLETWAEEEGFEANIGETVWDVLQRVFIKYDITVDADTNNAYGSIYIKSVNGLGEFDNGSNSGWMFTVNDVHPDVGVGAVYVKKNDVIILHYTDDYTLEENNNSSEDNSASSNANVQKVIDLITAIGNVTLNSETAINEARMAYAKLSKEEQLKVTNYQTLLEAEKVLSALQQSTSNAKSIYKITGNYFKGLVDKTTPNVGSIGGEWMVLGLARSGYEIPAGYFDHVVTYVKQNIDENGRLHSVKSTENSRLILALTAAGYDPANVGGYNLLNALTDMDYVKKQGINGPIWALLALDSHNYDIPGSDAKDVVTRTKLVNTILEAQLSDGGWALSGSSADSDMTGMALQSLAPYYSSDNKVKTAVDKALIKLSAMQEDNGAYATVGTITSESISQVIVGLTALGIDPNTDIRFIKNGFSVVDALLSFAVDEGGFKHIASGSRDGMASEQGYYALTAYMRMLNNENSLYNMTDVKLKTGTASGDDSNEEENQEGDDNTAAEAVEKLIAAIGTVTVNSESKITKARSAYKKLTAAQKKLVSNYDDLVDAEDALKEAKVKYVEELITAIGTVSSNSSSKTKISRARTAYDKLDSKLQKKVANLKVLEAAEANYAQLLEQSKTTNAAVTATTSKNQNSTSNKSTAAVSVTSTENFNNSIQEVNEMLEGVKEEVLLQEMLDVILAYEDLTEEEKEVFGKERHIEALKERITELGQKDNKTGISVLGADWNIGTVVGEVQDVEKIQEMKTQLSETDMLAQWDISLENLITGEAYEPEESVFVKIPLTLLEGYTAYDGLSVIHYNENGTAEYLNCTIVGDCLVFNTVEFSNFVISGYYGASPMEALLGEGNVNNAQSENKVWISWVIALGCSAGLFAVLLYFSKKNKEENEAAEEIK